MTLTLCLRNSNSKCVPILVFQNCHNEIHKLNDRNNRKVFFHHAGCQKSEIKVSTGPLLPLKAPKKDVSDRCHSFQLVPCLVDKISCVQGCQDSLVTQMVKNLPSMQETQVRSLGQKDPLEKKIATHSSILSWRIPWAEVTKSWT